MEQSNMFVLNVVNSGISLIMGFYLFFLQRNSLKHGVGYWAAGSLIVGLGLLIRIIAPVDSFFVLVGTRVLITIGLYQYLAGIWKFKELKIRKGVVIGIPILDLIQSAIFIGVFHAYKIQIGIHLLFVIIYCSVAIFEMVHLNADQKYLTKVFLLNTVAFIVFLVLVLLNVYALLMNPRYSPAEITPEVISIHLISGFIMIALTFGFLSAVNMRLRKELEGQLKSKAKFLSIIGHDLRGPVGNIMNFLDLIQNDTDLSERDKQNYIKVLDNLSRSTFHLLQNLLDWATKSQNLNQYESERIELSRLVASDIGVFESSMVLKSIDLKFEEGRHTFISGNANMLKTVVRNLVSNAIKFTPKGGVITIKSEKAGEKVRLVVADTGQGIKPENINSLFKFETSRSTVGTAGELGSGLGLPLCKELIASNEGAVRVESEIGIGTKVIVEFPFAD
ncbi:sensor histidine kinase [Mangrovibacterium sp.]|uniref:sensor histidine kinase n=1 Tax=Mangrovibacterium sp. TaxID=1961364 RepID=UPI0035671EA7